MQNDSGWKKIDPNNLPEGIVHAMTKDVIVSKGEILYIKKRKTFICLTDVSYMNNAFYYKEI